LSRFVNEEDNPHLVKETVFFVLLKESLNILIGKDWVGAVFTPNPDCPKHQRSVTNPSDDIGMLQVFYISQIANNAVLNDKIAADFYRSPDFCPIGLTNFWGTWMVSTQSHDSQ
jgi:hypothetical protein